MKPSIETIAERLDNHIETDDEAWADNKKSLERMEGKLDIACDWITGQKARNGMALYIASLLGAAVALIADKVWK